MFILKQLIMPGKKITPVRTPCFPQELYHYCSLEHLILPEETFFSDFSSFYGTPYFARKNSFPKNNTGFPQKFPKNFP